MEQSKPSSEQLFQEVTSALCELFGLKKEDLVSEADLSSDLDLDSIDIVDLLSTASDRYQISLSPYDFEGVSTLGDFCRRLEKMLNNESSPGKCVG